MRSKRTITFNALSPKDTRVVVLREDKDTTPETIKMSDRQKANLYQKRSTQAQKNYYQKKLKFHKKKTKVYKKKEILLKNSTKKLRNHEQLINNMYKKQKRKQKRDSQATSAWKARMAEKMNKARAKKKTQATVAK